MKLYPNIRPNYTDHHSSHAAIDHDLRFTKSQLVDELDTFDLLIDQVVQALDNSGESTWSNLNVVGFEFALGDQLAGQSPKFLAKLIIGGGGFVQVAILDTSLTHDAIAGCEVHLNIGAAEQLVLSSSRLT